MPKINVLSKNVAELIAAGEVIERPASVIKELLENSIDAGAKNISAEIKNGGISFIRVTDDGCGIAFDDVPVAFLRHATSKVASEEDLDGISTMGFRGEALASVAAVARIEMLSKQEDGSFGCSYKSEGGTLSSHNQAGCPNGTTIIIKDLFFNTPARLKFLKKDVSEGNAVASVVDKLALAHPEISFRFIRDNKPLRITPGNGDLYSAAYSIFGKQFAASLIPVNYCVSGIKVTGFASSPLFPRNNRSMQYFFVNTRYIKSSSCTAALEEGYRNSIMTGKYPACIINIEIDPTEVDVNVHPAKTEVRFSDDRRIFDAVYFAVKNAVLNADNKKEILPPVSEVREEYKPDIVLKTQETEQPFLSSFNTAYVAEKKKSILNITPKKTNYGQRIEIPEKEEIENKNENVNDKKIEIENKCELENEPEHENSYKFISGKSLIKNNDEKKEKINFIERELVEEQIPIKVIGELWGTYIICESGEKFILIDKHAAHERIRFEKLRKEYVSSSQLLVESMIIETDIIKKGALIENRDILSDAGIDIEDNGDYKIKINTIPSSLVGTNTETLLDELSNIFINGGKDIDGIFDEILHSLACKSAIKAHDKNDLEDLRLLAEGVWNDNGIRFCPHGRPIITSMSKKEIEKNFKRIL